MVNQYLRTQVRAELQPVELAWDMLLRFDGGEEDRMLIHEILRFFESQDCSWVLMGLKGFGKYIAQFGANAAAFEDLTIECPGALSEEALDNMRAAVSERVSREDNACVFLCVTDRYEAQRVISELPRHSRIYTLDVLKNVSTTILTRPVWREKYNHIYPIDLPRIDIREDLDLLLLDVPARSLAQLPVGFAYVYKAARQSDVNLQAIDVDLIAYHRYHSRRCLNYVERMGSDGTVHPQDPWQAENYIVWTDKKFVEYFADILDELTKKIIEAKPKVVGFSLHQTSHVSVARIAERIRWALPEVCIIVGGMSTYQHSVARRIFPEADYVVIGEADTMIGALASALARGERPSDLPGVLSRYDSPDRTYVAAPLPHNLDVLGAPDYSFTNLDWYRNWDGYRLMPLIGSRGCGWSRCTFCAERFNWRARTPEEVAAEIKYYTTRGFQNFVFNESDFNSNRSFVVRLCQEIIRLGIKANFTAQLRIGKDCDFEYYKIMRDAGFSCLRFGVDGLSNNTLKLQRKGYTKEMVMENLRHCHDLGIFTEVNLVIGVPGETDDDVDESAEFLIEMKDYIGRVAFINPLMLFVGSVYYFEPERHNIKFHTDREELYRQYFVSLPDTSWYSENPYIDHIIRRQRFFRIVDRIHKMGVPLGAFANFTAEYRKEHGEDSHTLSQPSQGSDDRPAIDSAESVAEEAPGDASCEAPGDAIDLTAVPAVEPHVQEAVGENKTEFQLTFYGSWSAAFLRGQFNGDQHAENRKHVKVVRLEDDFYFVKNEVVERRAVVPVYPTPQLLRSHKGYNLVAYRDQILGAPLILGSLDLTQDGERSDERIVKGSTLEEVIQVIDHVEAVTRKMDTATPELAARLTEGAGSQPVFYRAPKLLRSYKDYNLVGFRNQILAAPLALGPLDLNQDAVRADPRILSGLTEEDVVNRIDLLDSSVGGVMPVDEEIRVVPDLGKRKVNMRAGVLLRSGK